MVIFNAKAIVDTITTIYYKNKTLCIKSFLLIVIFIIAIIYAYILMQSCFGHCKNYIYIYFFFF